MHAISADDCMESDCEMQRIGSMRQWREFIGSARKLMACLPQHTSWGGEPSARATLLETHFSVSILFCIRQFISAANKNNHNRHRLPPIECRRIEWCRWPARNAKRFGCAISCKWNFFTFIHSENRYRHTISSDALFRFLRVFFSRRFGGIWCAR